MPAGFLGVSLEYNGLHAYTGRDPTTVNPPLVGLLGALSPGQQPVLRIGGNSADFTWWPARHVIPPRGVRYALTPGWLRTTRSLAQALDARLIMGVNLAAGRPTLAAAEARAFFQGIGRQYVVAFEIHQELGRLEALEQDPSVVGQRVAVGADETLELMAYNPERIALVLNRADTRVGITGEDVEAIMYAHQR